ncbi:THO complex subunit 7A [Spatholobus suberectus]|nr:THO complex subunit 7A [Spatholobus suberectus]
MLKSNPTQFCQIHTRWAKETIGPSPNETTGKRNLLGPFLLRMRSGSRTKPLSVAQALAQHRTQKAIEMLGKGRKVSGRGEAVAANYAFGPSEDDAIIKHRLLTRTTTTRGEPPLKKLQKKFTSFASEVDKEEDNYSDCEKLARAFLQELTTFEIPLLKSKAIVEANVREKENFNELKEEMNRQILRAQADIEDLKKQLEESKVERRHKEECESIRKLIALQPPRSETQKVISELEKEIAALDAENTAGSRMLELRKKQFALLLHVVCRTNLAYAAVIVVLFCFCGNLISSSVQFCCQLCAYLLCLIVQLL